MTYDDDPMLELERNYKGFRTKTIYFADRPYDVEGVDWVSYPNTKERVDVPGFTRQDLVNGILDLRRGEEFLWSNMDSKCRSDIKKTDKDELSILVDTRFEDFIAMNEEFRRAKNLPMVFKDYLRPPLPDFCTLFTAEHHGDIMGGLLFIKDDDEMYGMLGASRRLSVEKKDTSLIARANRRLWWEATRWGIGQGLSRLDMGNFPAKGSDPEKEGMGEFKRRFGAEATNYYAYRKVYTLKARLMDKYRNITIARRV